MSSGNPLIRRAGRLMEEQPLSMLSTIQMKTLSSSPLEYLMAFSSMLTGHFT